MRDLVAVRVSLSSCKKAAQWEKSYFLFADERTKSVAEDAISLNTALSAFEKITHWQAVIQSFKNVFTKEL